MGILDRNGQRVGCSQESTGGVDEFRKAKAGRGDREPCGEALPPAARRAEHGEFGQPLAAAKEKVVRIRGPRRLGAGRSGLLHVALRQGLWA